MNYITLSAFLLSLVLLNSNIPVAHAGGEPVGQVLGGQQASNTPSSTTGATGNGQTNGSTSNTSSTNGSTTTTGSNSSAASNSAPALDITITPFGDIGIRFNDGDLIKSPNEKKVYIMFRGLKTAAVSMQTLKRLGLETRPIKVLTFTQTETVPYGNPIILE